ncbi:ABC transporter permease [Atopobacter phocae]|uniref:ABC transporter permease n=1 Tax=Atopobacter phocae TaxID=136492 RepID=UPI0004714D0A|nr:ABC transporter permease subunit [Atopobacter phocae]
MELIKKSQKLFQVFIVWFILHLIWWLTSTLYQNTVIPSPIAVYRHFPQLISGKLGWHLYFSATRLFWGILISGTIALIVGGLMGTFDQLNAWINPVIYSLYPLPKIALLPIVMLVFGLREQSKITMIVLILVFQMIITVRDQLLTTPKSIYHVLRVLGAPKWRLLKEVTLPLAIRALISATRVALGTAMAVLFFTEIYGTRYGMGYFIINSWYQLDYIDMYAGILVLSAATFFVFILLEALEKYLNRWQTNYH